MLILFYISSNFSLFRSIADAFMDAGGDTSAVFILIFILAVVNNSSCQARAQAELDLLVGGDRMPTLDDLPSLPYINALIKEVGVFSTNGGNPGSS